MIGYNSCKKIIAWSSILLHYCFSGMKTLSNKISKAPNICNHLHTWSQSLLICVHAEKCSVPCSFCFLCRAGTAIIVKISICDCNISCTKMTEFGHGPFFILFHFIPSPCPVFVMSMMSKHTARWTFGTYLVKCICTINKQFCFEIILDSFHENILFPSLELFKARALDGTLNNLL